MREKKADYKMRNYDSDDSDFDLYNDADDDFVVHDKWENNIY